MTQARWLQLEAEAEDAARAADIARRRQVAGIVDPNDTTKLRDLYDIVMETYAEAAQRRSENLTAQRVDYAWAASNLDLKGIKSLTGAEIAGLTELQPGDRVFLPSCPPEGGRSRAGKTDWPSAYGFSYEISTDGDTFCPYPEGSSDVLTLYHSWSELREDRHDDIAACSVPILFRWKELTDAQLLDIRRRSRGDGFLY